MTKVVLVIGAHPDDELLGIGATARRHVEAGDDVHALIVCEGMTVRYSGPDAPSVDQRAQAEAAGAIIGWKSLAFWGLKDQGLDRYSQIELNQKFEAHVDALRPSVIYTHFRGDLNRDHQIVSECVSVAARPGRTFIDEVYAFEVSSSTGLLPGAHFQPDTFVDVTSTLETKLQALACYDTEVPPYPHPRSLESLRAHARSWGSKVSLEAAEPLMTLRRFWRAR